MDTGDEDAGGTSRATTVGQLEPAGTRRRVIVAGGRQLLRDAISALLRPDVDVVRTVATALAARSAIASGTADVVVSHTFLDDAGGGADLAVALREESPTTGVVLLLGDGNVGEIRTVLEQGTQRRALLMMDHPRCAQDLRRAVHEVAEGGSLVHPGAVDLILRAAATPAGDPLAALTPRERQVLAQIATGASNQGIAARLELSERAVEKHINQLYGKLGLPVEPQAHRRVHAVLHYASATTGHTTRPRNPTLRVAAG